MECHNLTADEEEEPRNVNIPESEGYHEVQGMKLEIPKIAEKVKIKKINIGTEVEPKFSSIGDIGMMRLWDTSQISYRNIKTCSLQSS